jgi:hypothetical protein
LVTIHKVTKSGSFRESAEWESDCDMLVVVNGMAKVEKNRFWRNGGDLGNLTNSTFSLSAYITTIDKSYTLECKMSSFLIKKTGHFVFRSIPLFI